jgi:S1-C subfamily serine protease
MHKPWKFEMPIAKLMLMTALLIALAACTGAPTGQLPDNAVTSTPIEALPVNIALRQGSDATPTAVPQLVIDAADAGHMLLANIYERVAPSVVNIEVTVDTPHIGLGDTASGSGFVYDLDGHIITNAHVVADSTEVFVTFEDGYITQAEIIGVDSYSDIAVLRVDTDESRLRPVVFGDSAIIRVGERAIAIGNPFGLASSMTSGIISALGRQLPSAELIDINTPRGFNNPSIIQVDTPINPGNSGGPLLNSQGEVIGVNTAISTETGFFGGVGFAVPAQTVLRVVPDLIDAGAVNYAWVGISSLSFEDGFGVAALAEPLELPVTSGVLIEAVTPNSPAAKSGLRGGSREVVIRDQNVCAGGDIIVAVNGTYIDNMDELVAFLVAFGRPGDTLNLLIVRSGETFEIPLTLEARPTDVDVMAPCGG